jgi:phage replication-related protein YjqB (UPF0714/DUF867 family)
MGEKFSNYQDLMNHYQLGVDYKIRAVNRGGAILILAPHGGGIERGTSELVRAIADNDLSYYLFEGQLPTARESQALHVTSTRFDEPECLKLIKRFQTSLAIHGCVGREPMIHVGGRDGELKNVLVTKLRRKGYPVQFGTREYAGSFLTNICNRTNSRKGVQLEFSNGLRRILFEDWRTRQSRKTTTALFARLVSDIRDVLE